MMRTVLVTGASGFIGRDLIVRLSHAGYQVRAAARNPATLPELAGIERVVSGRVGAEKSLGERSGKL